MTGQFERIDTLMSVSIKVMEGFGQLMELNVTAAKASLEERQSAMQSMMSAKDANELWAIQSQWMKPMPDKFSAYGRQCLSILQSSNTEITHELGVQSSRSQNTLAAIFDGLAKTAPVSSEAAAALAKNVVDMATNAFGSVQNVVLHNGHDHEAGHVVGENSMPNRVKPSHPQSAKSRG